MSVVRQRWLRGSLATAMFIAVAMPAYAQELKIGVVNIQALMQNAPQTHAAMEALQEEFAPREREVVAKKKELDDMTAKVQKDLAVMGEAERSNADKDIRSLRREFARLETEYREDINLRQNEELARLQRLVLKEVQDFAQSEGYDLIVGDGVLFASTAVNITEQVLRAVEANYQATGAR